MKEQYFKKLKAIPLHRIVYEYAKEFKRIDEKDFHVYIALEDFAAFMAEIKENFGQNIESPIVPDSNIVSINLYDLLPKYAVSIETAFPVDQLKEGKR